MSYKKLEIWNLARELSIKVHQMTLTELPAFELYEEGSQIRRSSKSNRSLIVEGYGRRQYKQDFMRFLVNALASNDESIDHLETLRETQSLKNQKIYEELLQLANLLGMKLNRFIEAVKEKHNQLKEPDQEYFTNIPAIQDQESSIEDHLSRIENQVSSNKNRESKEYKSEI